MPYSATAYRLLLSAPSDVVVADTETVMRTIARWNAIYGRQMGAVVVPVFWDLHSTAEHGVRPQAALNKQLVEDTDILVAIFWHRLGSDTGAAESGTVEEINEAQQNGAYVAILRCVRDVSPEAVDPGQVAKLSAFLDRIKSESLMLSYEDHGDLAQRVDAILTQAVTRSAARAEAATEAVATSVDAASEAAGPRAEVWPRIESTERVVPFSSGRSVTRRDWQLVLSNTGAEPARDVRFRLQEEASGDELPQLLDEDPGQLEALAPGGEAAYGLALYMGVAPQVRCVVSWEDSTGEHENVATLRFF